MSVLTEGSGDTLVARTRRWVGVFVVGIFAMNALMGIGVGLYLVIARGEGAGFAAVGFGCLFALAGHAVARTLTIWTTVTFDRAARRVTIERRSLVRRARLEASWVGARGLAIGGQHLKNVWRVELVGADDARTLLWAPYKRVTYSTTIQDAVRGDVDRVAAFTGLPVV